MSQVSTLQWRSLCLNEEREDHPLLAALVLGPAPGDLMAGVDLLGVAEVADVPTPVSR